MASRLPQPKSFGLKKPTGGSSESESTLKVPDVVPTVPPTNTTSTTVLKAIGKSKSTLNTNKAANENKPPGKAMLVRSQTSATIARGTAAPKVAVKRLGTTVSGIDSKRAVTRAQVNPVGSRGVNKAGVRGPTTGKAVGTAGTAGTKPKPSKWDLKGRLELASSELSSLKEKHKKCGHLESMVEDLQSREEAATLKTKELEIIKTTLSDELKSAKTTITEMTEKTDDLTTKLKETEDSYQRVTESLKKSKDTCELQKKQISQHASDVSSIKMKLEEEIQTNDKLNEKIQGLQSLVHQMDNDRRVLHNTIQELKGNIRVFCRVRPRISKEVSKALCAVNFIDEGTMEIGRFDAADNAGKLRGAKQEFSFDKIFPPTASQAQVFEELQLLVQSALEGYNVCVFAYGQTGSGKTYTMEGDRNLENEGMIPRTVRHIFREMKEFELLGWQYRIEASFLEIYNEHIVDLLDSQQKTHEIRMADSKGNDLYVTNLQVEEINSPEELYLCLQTAQRNRAVAATSANERSSRSHSVARIRLIGTHAEKDELSIGNLNLVDLAGSEKLKNEEAARTAETKNINKSLANLGNVILALLKKQDHIPYRNSKLTHLLMPSLGGNSKTLMLLNVSPLDECFNETLNSLRFASNVNSCKTGNVKRSRQMLHNSM